MRPARIQVFDGLRVATEHIDHLQDGLHSSIEDLREATGLGRIVRGFEVTVDGGGVLVAPGLAFDHTRNRIAVDEPQHLDVTFPAGENEQYLCAKYERVEDHQVEGKATLVWDSASLLLQPALPGPNDDPVALAKLVQAQDGSFRVVALDAPPPAPDAPAPDASPPATEATATTTSATTTETTSATETATASETVTATATTTTETTSASDTATTVTPQPPSEPSSPSPEVAVRQGVFVLPPAPSTGMQALVTALRARLAGQANGDLRVTLGSGDVAVDFAPAGVTCDASLSAEVRPTAKPAWQSIGTGHGEATMADGNVVAQYGLSSSLARPLAPSEGASPEQHAPDLTVNSLAQLPLAPGAAAGGTGSAADHVALAVRATASPGGFGVVCELVWSGDLGEDEVAALEGDAIALSWSVQLGWKAVGA